MCHFVSFLYFCRFVEAENGQTAGRSLRQCQEITQDGETYFVSSAGDDIVYTDGTHSVQIRQANRSGQNAPDYHTISECKAILALLGS